MKLEHQRIKAISLTWDIGFAIMLIGVSLLYGWRDLIGLPQDRPTNLIVITIWIFLSLTLVLLTKNIKLFRPLKITLALVLAFTLWFFSASIYMADHYSIRDLAVIPYAAIMTIDYFKIYITAPFTTLLYCMVKWLLHIYLVARSNPSKYPNAS